MSRSRRKNRYCGVTTARSDKWFKVWCQRRLRHINKIRLLYGLYMLRVWELTNQYWSPKDGKRWIGDDEMYLMRK